MSGRSIKVIGQPNSPEVLQERIRQAGERENRTLDVVLLSAYHQAKSLAECMALVNRPSAGRFTEQERKHILEAHLAVITALENLNAVIIDAGNQYNPVPTTKQ